MQRVTNEGRVRDLTRAEAVCVCQTCSAARSSVLSKVREERE